MAERKEITTKCHNCGRDSFLDLNCADCTRAFNRGQRSEYDKRQRLIKDAVKKSDKYLLERISRLETQLKVYANANNNLSEYCQEHSEDGHEFCDKCVEYGKKEERKRIYGFLKKRNFLKLAREFNKGD